MARSPRNQRPLPKPGLIDWIGGIGGIALVAVGPGLASTTAIGWFWLLFIAGLALTSLTFGRVGFARMDAMRSRPPM